MLLSGSAMQELSERGDPIVGDTLLVLLNAHSDKVPFTLPPLEGEQRWQRVFDTFDPYARGVTFKPNVRYPLQGRSVVLLKVTTPLRERRRVSDSEQALSHEPVSLES